MVAVMHHPWDPILRREHDLGDRGHVHMLRRPEHDLCPPPPHHGPRATPNDRQALAALVGLSGHEPAHVQLCLQVWRNRRGKLVDALTNTAVTASAQLWGLPCRPHAPGSRAGAHMCERGTDWGGAGSHSAPCRGFSLARSIRALSPPVGRFDRSRLYRLSPSTQTAWVSRRCRHGRSPACS